MLTSSVDAREIIGGHPSEMDGGISEPFGGEYQPRIYNSPPVVADIPDQNISPGQEFATIELDDYVSDDQTPDEDIIWSISEVRDLDISIDEDRIATITYPADWTGEEEITFTAMDTYEESGSDAVTFIVFFYDNEEGGDQGNGDLEFEEFPFGLPPEENPPGNEQIEYQHVLEQIDPVLEQIDPPSHPVQIPAGNGGESQGDSAPQQIETVHIHPVNTRETGIRTIKVTPTRYFEQITASIVNTIEKPDNIPSISIESVNLLNNGYQHIAIYGDGEKLTTADIASLTYDFRVDKQWMSENNIDPESIQFVMYQDEFIDDPLGSWETLTSIEEADEDEQYYYFEISAPGCAATFSVVGSKIVPVDAYSTQAIEIPWSIIIGVSLVSTVLLVIVLFKGGYIYKDENQPVTSTKQPREKITKKTIRQRIAVLLMIH